MEDKFPKAQTYIEVRKHIDAISILAGILYEYVNTLRGEISSKEKQIETDKHMLKENIASLRIKRTALYKSKICIEETKQVLKKCYKVDIAALETAEEL